MGKTIKGPNSVYSLVFRRIVKQLKNNSKFRSVVSDLRSWDGSAADQNPMTPVLGKPIVRLTPVATGGEWFSPDSQVTDLLVHVELAIASFDIDDVLDLWDLVVESLEPGNGTFAADLVALGAETGEVLFSTPAWDRNRETKGGASWDAIGQFKLQVLRSMTA